ncbi:MAG: hypothetical protein OQK94_03880 [Gammaproteobacteria bacterium]|nr:hypothetical protein [Gammaproteobacteria bacterium]MCW8839455.1 hypothetical protein [Gammaproteobacteria bacterium]MCW8959802.1 hypothetical protein [Gammaproteobacteria bacterium]MCW8972036.1 hypothetical protein [Gammaproteobacteria bacterium]MCW8993198.1 hypothetical protein [Gammaproteobacteria bacterium]
MLMAFLLTSSFLGALTLLAWRCLDHRADHDAMERLVSMQPPRPARFDPTMLDNLPDPARRYFLYAIEPGTPLYTVAKITMAGQFGMGNKAKPKYLDMRALQTLAMPAGFVWKMRARQGLMSLSGSDSDRWTRFWMMGLIPIARMGGDPDHTRSAFGRYVAEAVFWTPAAVLPGPGVEWKSVGKDCARLTVSYQGLSQSVDVTVAPDGQPIKVCFERWSNANAEKRHRLQPFGGYLSEFRKFAGFRLPTHVEAGNGFGTEQYFPFFVVNVTDIDFPHG